ncbi:protein of unknown function [Methylocella tundrae]|uniref:Uncharacterized protein n=1 Tax=Methylocella tundrae TaxID=227605 RepID=A0A4U8Z424_METTU|nr:protein of unknown function [Methylocella tundrae]
MPRSRRSSVSRLITLSTQPRRLASKTPQITPFSANTGKWTRPPKTRFDAWLTYWATTNDARAVTRALGFRDHSSPERCVRGGSFSDRYPGGGP